MGTSFLESLTQLPLMARFAVAMAVILVVPTLVVAVAAVGAEAIHLEGIIGAFLAGLALNRAAEESRAKHELEFLGNTLFIPMFFITVGFLIDVRVFAATLMAHLGLVTAIVGGLILSKLLAALLARRAFGYSRDQGLVMWSLSLPQVAATLAAALVAYEAQGRRRPKADRRAGAQQRDRPDGGHLGPGADPDRAVRQASQDGPRHRSLGGERIDRSLGMTEAGDSRQRVHKAPLSDAPACGCGVEIGKYGEERQKFDGAVHAASVRKNPRPHVVCAGLLHGMVAFRVVG